MSFKLQGTFPDRAFDVKVSSSGSRIYALAISRAVESDTWVVMGDGLREPAPLTLVVQIGERNGVLSETLQGYHDFMTDALAATNIEFSLPGWKTLDRAVRGLMGTPREERTGNALIVEVEFAPAGPNWLETPGSAVVHFPL